MENNRKEIQSELHENLPVQQWGMDWGRSRWNMLGLDADKVCDAHKDAYGELFSKMYCWEFDHKWGKLHMGGMIVCILGSLKLTLSKS
jgi:hypothetical protein